MPETGPVIVHFRRYSVTFQRQFVTYRAALDWIHGVAHDEAIDVYGIALASGEMLWRWDDGLARWLALSPRAPRPAPDAHALDASLD
jgi:hypothetical protein